MKVLKIMKRNIMNKVLYFIFIILYTTTSCSSQVSIHSPIFKVKYSEKLEQPLCVEYKVLCPNGNTSRSGMDFYKVDSVHTSDNEDYKNNIWDKGHIAPAAAFNCSKDTLKQTFSYLNCALQHESLNRGPWKELERFERNLAKFFDVHVIVYIEFEKDCEVLETGASVPSAFIKVIEFEKYKYTFKFPNSNVSGTNWFKFKVKDN
jgi:endonuclease G